MVELQDELEEIMAHREEAMNLIRNLEERVNGLHQEKMKLWKWVAMHNALLKEKCSHEWVRESYLYSPLYCKICKVER